MMKALRLIAVAICWLATAAWATPQPVDATGLWIKADESGWGMSVYHQGDTLFASLFVYGPDGQPKWYTASSLTAGPTVYSGALAEASGPYFGASPFDPNAVTRRVVGSMTLTLNDSGATLDYTIDGTRVTKPVTRFSMRPLSLTGNYYGVELQPASVTGTEVAVIDLHMLVTDNRADGPALLMDTASNTASPSGTCDAATYNGTLRSQDGETLSASGLAYCGPSRGSAPWSMTVDPAPYGFTGAFSGNGLTRAHIAAANRNAPNYQGSGWINDLWFPQDEGGWGLNLVEQGDTAFATLFVYDAQNRPRWYSASRLAANVQGGRPTWSGSLEESTGPYFGGSFDPAAVSRRVVGTMTFQVMENDNGVLSYTVNGVSVSKIVSRFAFRKNDLSGSYQGHVVMRSDDPRGLSYDDARITIDDQGDRVSGTISIYTGPTCNFTGQGAQYGSLRAVAGSCGAALIRMRDLIVTSHGLTGSYAGPAGHIGGTINNGAISGARR